MIDRVLSPGELALKSHTRLLIERVGGLDAAASCTRVGRSQLANYQSPNHDQFMPVDVLARLEEVAQAPILTEELARRSGRYLASADGKAAICITLGLAKVAKESADLHGAAAQALSDGRICADDCAVIEREALELMRVASDLLATIRQSHAA